MNEEEKIAALASIIGRMMESCMSPVGRTDLVKCKYCGKKTGSAQASSVWSQHDDDCPVLMYESYKSDEVFGEEE